MTILSVELLNDYEIDLKKGAYKQIKANKKLFDLLSVDNEIEGEEDIFISDLIESSEKLGLNFKDFLQRLDTISVSLDNGKEIKLTNFDLAELWDWHAYCEEMMCNWHGNYLMVTAADISDESGIMAIYDVSREEWIFSKTQPNIRGMIYAPEVSKFIAMYEVKARNNKSLGIIIIDPEKNFEESEVSFEAQGIAQSNGSEDIDLNEFNHYYRFEPNELDSDDFTGCIIDNDTILLWNEVTKCCYVKKGRKGYRYCF